MSNTSQRMLQQGQADQRPPWRKLPKIFRTNWSFVTPQPRLMVHSEKTDIQLSDSRKPLMKVMFYIQGVQKLYFLKQLLAETKCYQILVTNNSFFFKDDLFSYMTVLQWSLKIFLLKSFLAEDSSLSSSLVHFKLSKNLWSFEDFRPKIPKIFRKKAPFVEEILKEN